MDIVIVNAEVSAKLRTVEKLVEIRDADGNVMGYFAPAAWPAARQYAQAAAHFDPEEIRRRKESSEECFTTQEVLEHLKELKPISRAANKVGVDC
ncbi:MAG: hypothetical protein HY000_27970 [Planctomycetes bacterium]|nr:hypothetical protein [Planctomycetota bacterium]